MKKISAFFSALLLFFLFFAGIYMINVWFFKVYVILYSTIFDALLAASIVSIIMFFLPGYKIFSHFEKFQTSVIMLLLGYAFAISGPTIIERSMSFYILEKIQEKGGMVPVDQTRNLFMLEFEKERNVIGLHLSEQLKSGTILMDNNTIRLTNAGDQLATFSKYFKMHLLPKKEISE